MKNIFEINRALVAKKKFMMIIMAVALMALPAMAQEWQSTSTLQGTGSNYTPQVTAVGATTAPTIATTTESYSPNKAPSGPRRSFDVGGESGRSDEFPIGDAIVPMMLMAIAFGGYIAIRRKKQAAKS